MTGATVVQVETRMDSSSFTVEFAPPEEVLRVAVEYAEAFGSIISAGPDPENPNRVIIGIDALDPERQAANAVKRHLQKELDPDEQPDELPRKATREEAATELQRQLSSG